MNDAQQCGHSPEDVEKQASPRAELDADVEEENLFSFEVAACDADERLDVYLAQKLPWLSRTQIQRLIAEGAVTHNHRNDVKPREIVRAGDSITIVIPSPKPAKPKPQDIPLDIVYEDEDVLVINKPAGLAVHPGAGIPDGTLVNALLGRCASLSVIGGEARPGIVHRLDKDTSGLLIVAKNDHAHRTLSDDLATRRISRVYWAIVLRECEQATGVINAPIARHPMNRIKMAVVRNGGREAITFWKVVERFHRFTLVECRLATGRTHQIRVHMASIGHPILGDSIYGGDIATAKQLAKGLPPQLQPMLGLAKRQLLHARELEFVHPATKQTLRFEAPLPQDFQQVLDSLRKYARD